MLKLERPLRRHSSASQSPPAYAGCEGKGKFYHLPWWEFGCFLISVLASHGACLQQEGGQCPSPECSSSQAKEGLATHSLFSLWQLHPGAPVHVYVLLPQDIPAGFFLTEKTAAVKVSKWLFGAMGVGRISGKKAVLTRTCSSRGSGCFFHSCLLNLESLLLFCYAGRAVNAALAFFLNMFSSGFSSHQYVLFLGESSLQ